MKLCLPLIALLILAACKPDRGEEKKPRPDTVNSKKIKPKLDGSYSQSRESKLFEGLVYRGDEIVNLPWSKISQLNGDSEKIDIFFEELGVQYGEKSDRFQETAAKSIAFNAVALGPDSSREMIDKYLKGKWKNHSYTLIVGVISKDLENLEKFAHSMPFNQARVNAFESLFGQLPVEGELGFESTLAALEDLTEPEDLRGALLGFTQSLKEERRNSRLTPERFDMLIDATNKLSAKIR